MTVGGKTRTTHLVNWDIEANTTVQEENLLKWDQPSFEKTLITRKFSYPAEMG